MAIELPARPRRDVPGAHGLALPGGVRIGAAEEILHRPRAVGWSPTTLRILQALPGAAALGILTAFFAGYVWFPTELAVALLLFDAMWLWKSWTIAYHAVKGARSIKSAMQRDWRAEYEAMRESGTDVLAWEDVRHVVIIPNYKESLEKLRSTLSTLAAANGVHDSVIPVLAMEEADPESSEKAVRLLTEFRDAFAAMFATCHPKDLPGEVRGKSSNQAWAAHRAAEELLDRRGLNVHDVTLTSCDADTQFPPQYFEALTFHFATDVNRYRRFWQAPIFFYNNIWQIPAPLRVPSALGGLVHLARLSRQRKVLFSQSTYSLSMRMAQDVGYWDTDVIPEDWHMFLKCYYNLAGEVDVEPIYLPIGNDAALSPTPRATVANHYLQVRRWAWGAVDVPYAMEQAAFRTEIPWQQRYLRAWYVFENHFMWSTQWFLVTLGGFIPFVFSIFTGHSLLPGWFHFGSSILLTPCMLFYVILITLDTRMRPPAPLHLSQRMRALAYVNWLLISPITFVCSAMPALDSQIRLLLNRRMEYRVTEKV